jgi:hypothetical protein
MEVGRYQVFCQSGKLRDFRGDITNSDQISDDEFIYSNILPASVPAAGEWVKGPQTGFLKQNTG